MYLHIETMHTAISWDDGSGLPMIPLARPGTGRGWYFLYFLKICADMCLVGNIFLRKLTDSLIHVCVCVCVCVVDRLRACTFIRVKCFCILIRISFSPPFFGWTLAGGGSAHNEFRVFPNWASSLRGRRTTYNTRHLGLQTARGPRHSSATQRQICGLDAQP